MIISIDYNKVFEISHKIRFQIADGLHDLSVLPTILVQMVVAQTPTEKGVRKPKIRGPLMNLLFEATEQSILDTHLEKLEKIMENDAKRLTPKMFDPNLEEEPAFGYNLKATFQYFQASISPMPPKISGNMSQNSNFTNG